MKFYDALRAQHVMRWHIVNMGGRNQTLADHTFGVMVIALELARRSGHVFSSWDSFQGRLLEACLFHDIHEVVEGDIPTPTKRHYNIPESEPDCPPLVNAIVSVADKLEALFTLHDNATGVHAKQALDRYHKEVFDFLAQIAAPGLSQTIARTATDMIFEYTMGGRTIQWPEKTG
jgi:hypothetical protein